MQGAVVSEFIPAVPKHVPGHPLPPITPAVVGKPPTAKVFRSTAPVAAAPVPELKKVKKEYAYQVKKALGKPF